MVTINSNAVKTTESITTSRYDVVVSHITNCVYWKTCGSFGTHSKIENCLIPINSHIDDYFDNFRMLK